MKEEVFRYFDHSKADVTVLLIVGGLDFVWILYSCSISYPLASLGSFC